MSSESNARRTDRRERVAASQAAPFSEAQAWRDVGAGWQPIFGSFRGVGYSIEWHDFFAKRDLDWAASFHPNCVELCLNLEGAGFVKGPGGCVEFAPDSAGFYRRETEPLAAMRHADQHHRFLTVEYSVDFLAKHLHAAAAMLHPVLRAAVNGDKGNATASNSVRLTLAQQQIIATLRQPPVYAAAQPIWYECKAVELALMFFVQPPVEQELFCTRQQRLAQERVEQVMLLLRQNLAEPPSLEDLGRKIGCSHFYLSRIFSTHTGRTITQHLRQLRMDKAAELLRSGDYNVTEAALEVGYNSLSHFSAAFHETFGCCPGLYPLKTPTQKS
ncbi:MAG: helix-turn-helix transcriptional regulator [Verrucomicrobia bacterium]|nr:helix-turn-helix transcriptional regulator [Verrucomicrobiota bacterium]